MSHLKNFSTISGGVESIFARTKKWSNESPIPTTKFTKLIQIRDVTEFKLFSYSYFVCARCTRKMKFRIICLIQNFPINGG